MREDARGSGQGAGRSAGTQPTRYSGGSTIVAQWTSLLPLRKFNQIVRERTKQAGR